MPETEFAIWPPYEAFYIQSMLFNTQSAARSIEVISTVMEYLSENMSPDAFTAIDTEDVLNHLQNVIVQGAAQHYRGTSGPYAKDMNAEANTYVKPLALLMTTH